MHIHEKFIKELEEAQLFNHQNAEKKFKDNVLWPMTYCVGRLMRPATGHEPTYTWLARSVSLGRPA